MLQNASSRALQLVPPPIGHADGSATHERSDGTGPRSTLGPGTFLSLADTDADWVSPVLRDATISISNSVHECADIWRQAVQHGACTVFQTFQWQRVWSETIGRSEHITPVIVLVVAKDGHPLLIVPLGIFRGAYGRSLQFLGGDYSDYNAPITDRIFASTVDSSDVVRLWKIILRLLPKVDLVWLRRQPQMVDGLPNPLAALPTLSHADDAYAATLPKTYEAFAQSRSKQFFDQNRRKWRKLDKAGSVQIDIPDDPSAKAEIVRFLVKHKAQWQQATGRQSTLACSEHAAFFEHLTRSDLDIGSIHVTGLRFQGELVAGLWGIIFRGEFLFLLTAYDERWSHYSVGRLVMDKVIQTCISRGDLSVFDLTIGDEPYKASWSDRTTPLFEYKLPRTPRGWMYYTFLTVRERLKRSPLRGPLSRLRSRLRRTLNGVPNG